MLTVAGVFAGVTVDAAPLSAANAARLRGCGASGSRAPLFYNMQLQRAAQRYSHGDSLQRAIAEAGYLAAQSAAIHLSGPTSDAEMESMLVARECRTLQDPRIREFGAERRGRDTWMIFAAPVSLPAKGDEASTGRAILDLVNAARAAGRRCGGKYFAAAAPLALDPALTRAALEHARDMAKHDAFDHRGHDGSSPGARVDRAGFGAHRIVGENIAAGAMTPAEVTQGWLASPAHCENIMDSRFTSMGVAFAENLHTASAVFWAQDFAAHR
ncbi:MAG TPA: CAP domain-containing protein [Steroidobacteraceae bacterium]|jgi:uncharacterized protein YkwD